MEKSRFEPVAERHLHRRHAGLRRRSIRPSGKWQGGQATGVDRRLQVFPRPRTVQRRRQQERRGGDHEKRDLSVFVEQGHARSDPVLPHG
jgi:hypothetical protein